MASKELHRKFNSLCVCVLIKRFIYLILNEELLMVVYLLTGRTGVLFEFVFFVEFGFERVCGCTFDYCRC